jgi:hypothetical protein
MATRTANNPNARRKFVLRLTPAEWRFLLQDGSFLRDPDNSCLPRRLMGIPVEIVPDHNTPPPARA